MGTDQHMDHVRKAKKVMTWGMLMAQRIPAEDIQLRASFASNPIPGKWQTRGEFLQSMGSVPGTFCWGPMSGANPARHRGHKHL